MSYEIKNWKRLTEPQQTLLLSIARRGKVFAWTWTNLYVTMLGLHRRGLIKSKCLPISKIGENHWGWNHRLGLAWTPPKLTERGKALAAELMLARKG